MATDTKLLCIPIIVGAVYQRQRHENVSEEVLCVAAVDDRGIRKGLFRRFGYADETLVEGTEEMLSWTVLFNPMAPPAAVRLKAAKKPASAEKPAASCRAARTRS
jgi:hypothetical protein